MTDQGQRAKLGSFTSRGTGGCREHSKPWSPYQGRSGVGTAGLAEGLDRRPGMEGSSVGDAQRTHLGLRPKGQDSMDN